MGSLLGSLPTGIQRRLLRARVWSVGRLRPSDTQFLLLLAACVGVVGALSSELFRLVMSGLHGLLTGQTGWSIDSFAALSWWQRILIPAVGGAAAGCALQCGERLSQSERSSDYMEAIVVGDGRLSFRKSMVRSLSALFSGASGASIGREGPLVQIAAMLASLPGGWMRMSLPMRRQLVACGAAAGIASAYNAPIAGALFVAEIVLGSLSMESFAPLVVSSVAATLVTRALESPRALYFAPTFVMSSYWELVPFVGLGILCGLLAPVYLRFLRASERGFRRLPLHRVARLALGGTVVGVLSVMRPEVCGNGYGVLYSVLHTDWLVRTLLVVLVFKVIATGATFGSGAVGGVFTPTLLTGGALGYLVGSQAAALAPFHTLEPSACALVGMGGFLSAATGAPVMAMLMVFELTLNYQVIPPLMLACVLGYVTSRSFESRFLYGDPLERKSESLLADEVRNARAGDLMRSHPLSVAPDATFRVLAQTFLQHRFNNIYVVDPQERFLGAVSLHDIKGYLDDPDLDRVLLAQDIQHEDFPTLAVDTPLDEALVLFSHAGYERLPVLAAGNRHLVGTLSKSDVLLHLLGHTRKS